MAEGNIQKDQKYLVKSAFLNLAGTALKVIAPVLMIVVARVFDKALFGVYVSTQLWVLTMSRVAVLGLDKGLHRYIPQNIVQGRDRYEGIMESVFGIAQEDYCYRHGGNNYQRYIEPQFEVLEECPYLCLEEHGIKQGKTDA